MKILKNIAKKELLRIYLKENKGVKGPDYGFIKRILYKSKEVYFIELNEAEIENIIVPNHFLCNCNNNYDCRGIVWKSFGGKSLKKVFNYINKVRNNFPSKFPICWGKIKLQRKLLIKNKSTIFVSQGRPLFFNLSYFGLRRINSIFLIDGFHRLMAYESFKKKPKNLRFILVK